MGGSKSKADIFFQHKYPKEADQRSVNPTPVEVEWPAFG